MVNMTRAILQSGPVRKGKARLRLIRRDLMRDRIAKTNPHPPIILNSFPKSGTHLFAQILGSLPGTCDHGAFFSSRPTLTYREVPSDRLRKRIARTANGELAKGHLFHSRPIEDAIKDRGATHFFLFRDLRDVAVSEAHYLATGNRWHRLHPTFKRLRTDEDRIRLSIGGAETFDLDLDFPHIGARWDWYRGWLDEEVMPLRFEWLRSSEVEEVVREVLKYLHQGEPDRLEDVARAVAAIDPSRSHTFRSGRAQGWRDSLSRDNLSLFEDVAGDRQREMDRRFPPQWGAA